jgi:hypothetical protein
MQHESNTVRQQPGTGHPNLLGMGWFFVRSKCLQAKRAMEDTSSLSPELKGGALADFPFILAESESPLHTTADRRERPLLLGKIHNLRLASRNIHRRILLPDQTFSFWRQVGPPWKSRGFEMGREVREGCVIPTPGGGVCQLSGSLLEVALSLGFEIIERHGHTALPPDVSGDSRRDATVFWNYVDLRFRAPFPVLLESVVTEDSLVIRVLGKVPRISMPAHPLAIVNTHQAPLTKQSALRSCHVCHETACFRHRATAQGELSEHVKTAFLLDEYQPEFDAYLQQLNRNQAHLLVPFLQSHGDRIWHTHGFEKVRSFPLFRFWRSLMLRRAVRHGLTVARAHFALAESLAKIYEKHITYDVEHLCIAQTLLPHLWRAGVLGGRSFDVLMARFPAKILERHLDDAARLYPYSKTLTEFRAPRWFVEAEEEALHSARRIISPHPQITNLFGNALRLPWAKPIDKAPIDKVEADQHDPPRDLIVFLGPTLARKGAYAVREAVKRMGFSLVVLGPDLEQPGFWNGLPIIRTNLQNFSWSRVHAVLQPALIEYWPRQLLRAQAARSRLVVSPNCGIAEDPDAGVHHVHFGDVDALVSVTETLLTNRGTPLCAA